MLISLNLTLCKFCNSFQGFLSFRLKKLFIRRKIEKIKYGQNVWFISDTHFSHRKIIRYSNRPFKNQYHMNNVLIKNWNQVVKPHDRVYFLGDFGRLGLGMRKKLKGRIKCIRGNHDRISCPKQRLIQYKGLIFLLIHDPNDHTRGFTGDWIIHGHTHGYTDHIDKKGKRINVSVEVIDYKPINFDEIIKEIQLSSINSKNIHYKFV